MAFFRDPVGVVFWLDEEDADAWRRPDWTPLSAADAAGIINPPKTQAELDAEQSAAALAELREIDLASIRSMREYIASKADAPQYLKDKEAAAIAARARVKV